MSHNVTLLWPPPPPLTCDVIYVCPLTCHNNCYIKPQPVKAYNCFYCLYIPGEGNYGICFLGKNGNFCVNVTSCIHVIVMHRSMICLHQRLLVSLQGILMEHLVETSDMETFFTLRHPLTTSCYAVHSYLFIYFSVQWFFIRHMVKTSKNSLRQLYPIVLIPNVSFSSFSSLY